MHRRSWERLTVLAAAAGAGPLHGVEVLGEQGKVGLRGALVVFGVWRLLHHLFDLLDHLNGRRYPPPLLQSGLEEGLRGETRPTCSAV